MTKKFCDLCGKPADAPSKIEQTMERGVLCDSKARIKTTLHIGFVDHSTGFGGPPDLCGDCLFGIVEAQIRQAAKFRSKG